MQRELPDSTNRANTCTRGDFQPEKIRQKKEVAPCDLNACTQKDRSVNALTTHTHSLLVHKHNKSEHRCALKPSCLTSSVGLIGSYLVSIELCACLQQTEQNSHSTPWSFCLCEYERETKRQRTRGTNENHRVELVHHCRSTNL